MKKNLLLVTFGLIILFFCFQCTAPGKQKGSDTAEIGHFLFFDKRLSYNKTKSCASCHDPVLAFTDGYHRSLGASGDIHKRNAPTLLNISENPYFTFSDSSIHRISRQVEIPLFNKQFIELGAIRDSSAILLRIQQDPLYGKLLKQIGRISLNWKDIQQYLEDYCMGLQSYQSKYDKVLAGTSSFTLNEKQGAELFFSKKLGCSNCHGGINFNTPVNSISHYSNNGFYESDSSHVVRKFSTDLGLFELTNKTTDIGQFKIPTLRNCILTSPYMHDGSINTLDSVITIYAQGGNSHINKHNLIKAFSLNGLEKRQLLQFLQTLTDTAYLRNPYFTDPF